MYEKNNKMGKKLVKRDFLWLVQSIKNSFGLWKNIKVI